MFFQVKNVIYIFNNITFSLLKETSVLAQLSKYADLLIISQIVRELLLLIQEFTQQVA